MEICRTPLPLTVGAAGAEDLAESSGQLAESLSKNMEDPKMVRGRDAQCVPVTFYLQFRLPRGQKLVPYSISDTF